MIHTSPQSRIFFLRFVSGVVMTLERLAVCCWRLLVFIGFFVALWLFEIPSIFGIWSECAALAVFTCGTVYFIIRDLFTFRVPGLREIDRRIEKDSHVPGRPLSEMRDRLVNPQKQSARDLWATAREKLLRLLPLLHPARFKTYISQYDPHALRLGVIMAVLLGLLAAGPDAGQRIRHGLKPFDITAIGGGTQDHYTLWITPPEYTRMNQIVITENSVAGETIRIPQGSQLKAIVNRGWGTPRLSLGEEVYDFTQSAAGSYGLEATLSESSGQALQLKQGFRTLTEYPYAVIPDTPPAITVSDKGPNILAKGESQFGVAVKDDYGVEYLRMDMRLDPMVEQAPVGEPYSERRSIASPPGQNFEMTPVYDLTAHSWAGLPVEVTFTAIDHLGQKTVSEPVKMTLPERAFSHPVAKTLVAFRKTLAWQPKDADVYTAVTYELETLLRAPDALLNDVVIYLGIRSAASRLKHNMPSREVAKSVMALLWDTALRLEDGDLSLAARRMREAQQALENALDKPDVSDEEVAQLMHELRQAMAEYFTELGREMQKRAEAGEQMPMLPPEMMSQMLDSNALADFLDQLEAEMREGNTDSAQQLLSQMQRLMDMLNPSMSAEMPQDMQMMQKGISELQKLIERQESLLEQTREQAEVLDMLDGLGVEYGQELPRDGALMERWGMDDLPPAPGYDNSEEQAAPRKAPFVDTADNKVEQDALRFILGQLMVEASEQIGEIPESMGQAELEMRNSANALSQNDPKDSAPHQEKAVEHLKESQEQLAQQLQTRMQQMTGFMLSFGGGGMKYDPLGRSYGEGSENEDGFGSNVKIPDAAERRRVEEILDLLRQRSGERNRPREELEYYRRLLKRF